VANNITIKDREDDSGHVQKACIDANAENLKSAVVSQRKSPNLDAGKEAFFPFVSKSVLADSGRQHIP
jgi:hypothetical protein